MSRPVNVGRPWTPYEDHLLIEAVRIHGENTERWKTIASAVPGRTNKACRKRWLHSLSPNVKKCAWSPEEDRLLLELFELYPNKWSLIARGIPGRTDDACSKRYREALDPRLRKDDWTEEEDQRLLELLARDAQASKATGSGGGSCPKWGRIGQELSRSGLSCRNRWRRLERKKSSAIRQAHPPTRNDHERPADMVPGVAEAGLAEDAWPLFVSESENTAYWHPPWDALAFEAHGSSMPANASLDTMIVDAQQPLLPASVRDAQSHHHGHRFSFASTSLAAARSRVRTRNEGPSAGAAADIASEHEGAAGSPVLLPSGAAARERVVESDLRSLHLMEFIRTLLEKNLSREQNPETCDASSTSTQTSRGADDSAQGQNRSVRVSVDAGVSEPSNVTGLGANERDVGYQTQAQTTITSSSHEIITIPRKRRRKDNCLHGGYIAAIDVGKRKATPKLSSTLPISTGETILAYTCGHRSCWSAAEQAGENSGSRSRSCFATSGELWTHYRDIHLDRDVSDSQIQTQAPFRCGLVGCNKGWKSINGLQYHLQMAAQPVASSKEHYQTVVFASRNLPHSDERESESAAAAIAGTRPSTTTAAAAAEPKEPSGSGSHSHHASHETTEGAAKSTRGDVSASGKNARNAAVRKMHGCPHAGCRKSYKQLSGLRYHLSHGHPRSIPAQLEAMPPTLARRLGVPVPVPVPR